MEVRDRRCDLEALGARGLAVGFSPPAPLAQLAEYLQWPWPFLSDYERMVYRRLHVPRARLRDVYTVGTLRRYLHAARRRAPIRRPVEDTRQLGADVVVVDGCAVWIHRPRSPDDHPSADTLIGVVRRWVRSQHAIAPPP